MKRMLFACGALAAILASSAARGDETFERALSLAAEKRNSESREALDPLLRREPGDPRARLLDGVLRAREGRVGEAIDIFEALGHEFPDMSEPYNNLAVLHAREGRLEAARELLLATLERRPAAVVYANLGHVHTKLARRAYERARELKGGGGAAPDREADTAVAVRAAPFGTAAAGPGSDTAQSRDSDSEPRNAATASAAPAMQSMDATSSSASSGTERRESEAASAPATFCAHAGGFRSRRAVAEAALWLQSYGVEALEVHQEERRSTGSYQVYLPPFEDRDEAVAELRAIRDRGVRDVALIGEGELANGISFGIYREADNVHRRVAALGQLGYAVKSLAADVEVVTEYVVRARASVASDTLGAAWGSRFPGRAMRVVDCG